MIPKGKLLLPVETVPHDVNNDILGPTEPNSDGLQPRSDGLQPNNSNGLQPNSNGL